jgi:Protein of unknown function (DUF2877)
MRDAAYVDFAGSVVAVTRPSVPLMPNGVTLRAERWGGGGSRGWLEPDRPAILYGSGIDVGTLHVSWPTLAPTWEPRVAGGPWRSDLVLGRGRAILRHLGIGADAPSSELVSTLAARGIALAQQPDSARAMVALLASLGRRDPQPTRAAAESMLGLGQGLTPEGDDLLAAAAVTVVAFGSSVGLEASARQELVQVLVSRPEERRERTTSLSATLLGLAGDGRPIEPVARLLDLDDDRSWITAEERLRRIGHTTGFVYAFGVGASAVALARSTFA